MERVRQISRDDATHHLIQAIIWAARRDQLTARDECNNQCVFVCV